MPELFLLIVALTLAGLAVLGPMRTRASIPAFGADAAEEAEMRHRLALEAIRDLDADRRAGSLDDVEHAERRRLAEAQAALTLRSVSGRRSGDSAGATPGTGDARRPAALAAAIIGLGLVLGLGLPAPVGLANATLVDQGTIDARAVELARQDRIAELLTALDEDPTDLGSLSDLADAYLAGDTREDLVRAATALSLLIGLEPTDVSAHQRIVTAYIRAGDYRNARAALDALRGLDPAPTELAFFEGVIALRGEDDAAAAIRAFDRFLQLAPDDPRVGMVRALRAEAGEAAQD